MIGKNRAYTKEWYDMDIFSSKVFVINGEVHYDLYVTRIPSGWLVNRYSDKSQTFIPYDGMDHLCIDEK